MWRDGTLLFPCVPAVALFSLVGSWDSFKGATFAFFGFLLSFATLFARSQRRTMAHRAKLSGYQDLDRLRTGPWRWMAGPEWAFASAAAVVLISLLGAPVIQLSVQGVAGFVRITAPTARSNPNQNQPTLRETISGEVRIGQGPRELTHTRVLTVAMDAPRYLRTKTFDIYTGRGWRITPDFVDAAQRVRALRDPSSLVSLGRNSITSPKTIPFAVQYFASGNESLPIPGEIASIDPDSGNLGLRPDGTVAYLTYNNRPPEAKGSVIVSDDRTPIVSTVSQLRGNYVNEDGKDDTRFAVSVWAAGIVNGAKTDYEKALRLKRAIEQMCVYNLNAPAIDRNKDAVSAFLFETKEGYCDLFASAMTVCARSVGLPARYVQGYLPSDGETDREGRFTVYESDYHAWCEILFEDAGWTVFDATEGAVNVEGGERGGSTVSEPFYKKPWFATALFALMGLTLASTLVLSIRNFRVAQRSLGPRVVVGAQFERLVDAMERVSGRPRRLHESPSAYFESVKTSLGACEVACQTQVTEVENFLYGPNEPTPDDLKALRKGVGETCAALRRLLRHS